MKQSIVPLEKLTEISKLLPKGVNKMIAEKFGVGPEYVSMVRHGRYINHEILTELILIASQEQKKRKAIIKKAEAATR